MNDASNRDDPREIEYRKIVAKLPTYSDIFLPTDKFNIDERLAGIRIVRDIYRKRLDSTYRPKLRALREKYKGTKRCFIIGNGPSLNQTDLSVLKHEVTFAVNGFFLKTEDLDWLPTFYVVEDHLVAEDRSPWINKFKGPTKLFPVCLAYCLDEGDDTIFLNHLPRKSYPHGFDFSPDASEVTYTGCTVTFTCMQLAFYLGFEEIYLIGVDASYDLPKDVERGAEYSVSVLDMKSDDPNHFHPDYFGKGFRWHDPQVDKMIDAYQEARRITDATNQRIFNATLGGKLEVFERRAYANLFPNVLTPDEVAAANEKRLAERVVVPRLLVFDLTEKGDGTATGELKSNLFSEWPPDRYLQIYSQGAEKLGVQRGSKAGKATYEGLSDADKLMEIIDTFQPELILYRPVPNTWALNRLALQVIASRPKISLVTWIMDDWPAQLEANDPAQFLGLRDDWSWLLEKSVLRLSICDRMSTAFKERYGYNFEPFANAVDPAHWPEPHHRAGSELVVRYAGALADNMTARSVLRVAEAVEALANEGLNIRLEIRTRDIWKNACRMDYARLKRTTFTDGILPQSEYRDWMRTAGAVLIAYNFDNESLRYIALSMANKLPECLASGAPLIVHGPKEAATVGYLSEQNCALILDEPELEKVKTGLLELMDENRRRELGARGRDVAFTRHNLSTVRSSLTASLVAAAKSSSNAGEFAEDSDEATLDYPRSLKMSVDETNVVAYLKRRNRGTRHVMIDVGAHVGTSAAYFADLDWSVYCFEPDATNRAKLQERLGKKSNVVIDPRAVGEAAETDRTFYVSEESTGIGTLHAFRDTHRPTAAVDVTTVADVVGQRGLDHIDFLKIDVEGLDFAVLKGVPWDTIMPKVIECEFEDAKTLPLGHSYRDMADYLIDKGYTVYVSEWHPIVRYGTAHDWRRLVRYPSALKTPEAWGNLLAFREDPGLDAVKAAFEANLTSRERPPARLGKANPNATLVVLGNGPSLRDFDFERLRRFDCIGMNAAYRYWERIGWYPRYYTCLDVVVGLSHKDEIAGLIRDSDKNGIELFFLRNNLTQALPKELRRSPRVVDFDALLRGPLAGIAADSITTGSHTAVIGALLGYSRIALLGIDCNYVEEVEGARQAGGYVLEMVETPEDNPNYFFADYQRSGDKYHRPNPGPNLHVESWRKVAPFLRSRSVKVWNCNPDSRVDAFPFRSFDEIEGESWARDAQPRSLKISRSVLFAPRPTDGRSWLQRLAAAIRPRSFVLYQLGWFVAYAVQAVWQRRYRLGGAAILAILVPLLTAFFVPNATLAWVLVGLSGCAALALVALLVLSAVQVSWERRWDDNYTREEALSRKLSAAEARLKLVEAKLEEYRELARIGKTSQENEENGCSH